MIKLQTPVECGRSHVGISYNDKILVLGSCFADNIGQKLTQAGFDVCVNPFGALYNPLSLRSAIDRLESGTPFDETDCVEMGAGSDKICSFYHHTSFARNTRREFLDNANAALDEASAFYSSCNKVLVTLGTSFCYVRGERVVSNCLKRPASEFDRFMLESHSTKDIIAKIVDGSDRKYIFTVSPIRHMSDGAVTNNLSKASLLLAVSSVCLEYRQRTDYFPSYEIVMDELRDYRFYAEDMVHLTAQAIGYLWERFISFALPDEERGRLLEKEKAFRRSQHRQILSEP